MDVSFLGRQCLPSSLVIGMIAVVSGIYSLLLLARAACPLPENGQALIAQLEANTVHTVLPDERKLDEYARSYTVTDDCKILAHYVVPWGTADEFEEDFQRLLADPPPIARRMGMEDYVAALEAWRLREGQTQWVADPLHLPEIFDGSCDMVAVEFDLETMQATKVSCSGTLEAPLPPPVEIPDIPLVRIEIN